MIIEKRNKNKINYNIICFKGTQSSNCSLKKKNKDE